MEISVVGNVFFRMSRVDTASMDVWFFHGFGGSGQIFQEAFRSPLAETFNLYVPDLPGCGVTPSPEGPAGLEAAFVTFTALIRRLSGTRPIAIIAHSMGGVLGTWLAREFGGQVRTYISIEGNLTEADAYFCGLAAQFESASAFHDTYKTKVFAMLRKSGEALRRHYASLHFADAEGLSELGRSGAAATGETKSGAGYLQLRCKKIYYWAEDSTPEQTQAFIARNDIASRRFDGHGHWPMIDIPDVFYAAMVEDLQA